MNGTSRSSHSEPHAKEHSAVILTVEPDLVVVAIAGTGTARDLPHIVVKQERVKRRRSG